MLILTALWLHTVLVGAVLRPTKRDESPTHKQPGVQKRTEDDIHLSNLKQSNRDLQDMDNNNLNVGLQTSGAETSFWNNFTMWCVLLYEFFCSIAYFTYFVVMPAYLMEDGGASAERVATHVSITALSELISRPLIGLLMTNKWYNPKATLLAVTCSSIAATLGFTVSYWPLDRVYLGYNIIFGMTGGVYLPISLSLLHSCVKPQDIGKVTGLQHIALGLGAALGAPISGNFLFFTQNDSHYNYQFYVHPANILS